MINIVGYDVLQDEGLRYIWINNGFNNYIESAAFFNRSKGKRENICGYTTSVSSGCILKKMEKQCTFCRTGNLLPFEGLLTYREIAKQNIFMVLTDLYCSNYPELAIKQREFAYMGQGEPGYNYENVRKAIELTNRVMRELNQVVHRHIFATSGVDNAIIKYIEDVKVYYTERVTLHYSLHATENRSLIMPIDKENCYLNTIKIINTVMDATGNKPCIGILLFNNFQPKCQKFKYSNLKEQVEKILDDLDPLKCRLSFCEYNDSPDIGVSEQYGEAQIKEILDFAIKRGFETKFFSSYGKNKQTACGMLGGRQPEHVISRKWKELNDYAEDLINKFE